ncbi:c-type cytochrome [Palleronia caenipelagi]|uniref:C-type cytochrome n=1 Tax=Palleronia caenipelagi TaxID=2489174 RepID=A0A547Q0A7_9RHOB|nr:c-type cytochrome [Palleronia caenipelagi]TRD19824.1 c-type cytochrome [Palleronia caenipelagi]
MKLRGHSVKSLLAGGLAVVAAGSVVGLIVFAFAMFGGMDLSARKPDPKIVYHLLHRTFKSSVARRAPDEVPEDLDDRSRVLLGAQHYANACAKCHGGPGLGQNPQALAMRPRPQHLASVVEQFSDGELHYIVDEGVRMSAMPAWPAEGRGDEIWNVVAFLRQLPDMTADEYVALLQPRDLSNAEAAEAIAYGTPGAPKDNGLQNGIRWPEEEYAYASPATEWRDFAIEGDLVQRCAACHGAEGAGSTTEGRAPNLTTLSAGQITRALDAYASGNRKSGIMQIVAANLSEGQRKALGDYYDSLPDQPSPMQGKGDMALGEQIATEGKLIAGVPACLTCHNDSAPSLAGQSASYIEDQLHVFATEVRGAGGYWKAMPYVAQNLTMEERAAVATYMAAQDPAAKPPVVDLLASADPAAGAEVVERICKECHQSSGLGSEGGDVPNLTLTKASYLHQQLWKFREELRPSSKMNQTARRLSEDEIANVAAYFGTLTPVRVDRDGDAEAIARGATIAQNGIPDSNVPSCLGCHGGETANPLIPRLNGQNVEYLRDRLDTFQGVVGERIYGFSPMPAIASQMTAEQRDDVAAWFAAQEPLAK